MKKLAVLMVALMTCCMLVFTGCSGSSNVEGTTWALSGGTASGQSVNKEQLEGIMGEITYTFEKDGKLKVSAAGQTGEGTWKQDGDKITVTATGQTLEMTVKGNKLTADQQGVSLEFSKK